MTWSGASSGEHFIASNPALPGPTRILAAPTGGDDSGLFTAAIAAMPTGGKIILSGLYSVVAGNIPLANANDLTFEAASDVATGIINNGTNPMFVVSGNCARNKFRNMYLKNAAGAGHIFSAGSSVCSYWVFDGVFADISLTSTKSVWDHRGAGMNYIGMEWKGNYTINGAAGASVPAFNIVSDAGGANGNLFGKGLVNSMGFYPFWIESTNVNTFAYDNKWRDVLFENPTAGCVKTIGCLNPIFDTCTIYDLTTSTADLFSVSQGSGGVPRMVTFRNIGRRGGTIGGGLADIAVLSAASVLIEMSSTALNGSPLIVNGNGSSGIIVVGGPTLFTWLNKPSDTIEWGGGTPTFPNLNVAGVLHVGAGTLGGSAAAGDIVARRSATTGAVYFGEGSTVYVYFDGTRLNLGAGAGALSGTAQLYPGSGVTAATAQTAAGILGGTGVPTNAVGNNGDIYIRSDGGAGTTIYQKRTGAWVATGA